LVVCGLLPYDKEGSIYRGGADVDGGVGRPLRPALRRAGAVSPNLRAVTGRPLATGSKWPSSALFVNSGVEPMDETTAIQPIDGRPH